MNAWWVKPKDGSCQSLGHVKNAGVQQFDPPGKVAPGNDWVLALDDASKQFPRPGDVP